MSSEQLNLFRELRVYDVNDECPCDERNWLVYDQVDEDPGKIVCFLFPFRTFIKINFISLLQVNNFRPPIDMGNRELREVGGH